MNVCWVVGLVRIAGQTSGEAIKRLLVPPHQKREGALFTLGGATSQLQRRRPATDCAARACLVPTAPGLAWHWNGPSWSLSAEWFAYLLFPAFAWIGIAWRRRPCLLLALAAAVFLLFDLAYRTWLGRILPHAEENLGVMRIVPEFL